MQLQLVHMKQSKRVLHRACGMPHAAYAMAPSWVRAGSAEKCGMGLSWLIDVGMAMGSGGLPCDRMMTVTEGSAGGGRIALGVLEGE
jgi:hypothetical protein